MPDYIIDRTPRIKPYNPQGTTITTNTSNPDTPTFVEPPTSNWAVTAVAFLFLGFVSIFLGLFIPAVILYTTIIGGALILTANTLAILSLREDQ